MDYNTETKNHTRAMVMARCPLAYAGRRRRLWHARTALLLAGEKMLCAKKGIQTGLLRPCTYYGIAEHDPEIQKKISRVMHNLKSEWEPYFHRGEIITLDPARAFLGHTLDFAYLDFCSAMSANVYRWMQLRLLPHMTRGGALAITLSRNWRTNKFMGDVLDVLRNTDEGSTLVDDAWNLLMEATRVGTLEPCYQYMGTDDIPRSSKDLAVWSHPRRVPCPGVNPFIHQTSVELFAMLRALMNGYRYDLDMCVEYRRLPGKNTCPHMVTYRFTNLCRAHTPEIPTIVPTVLAELAQPATARA